MKIQKFKQQQKSKQYTPKKFQFRNFSHNHIYTIKDSSLKNSISHKYNNKIPAGSRIFSSKILSLNKDPNLNLKFKINNDSNTFKISAKNYQKIRNLNSIETLFGNKVKIKQLKIFNEENKNKIKNDSKYKLLNPKFGYINKTGNF